MPWCAYRLLFVGYEGVDPQLDINIIGTSGTEIVRTRRCLLRFGFSETAETKHSQTQISVFGTFLADTRLLYPSSQGSRMLVWVKIGLPKLKRFEDFAVSAIDCARFDSN